MLLKSRLTLVWGTEAVSTGVDQLCSNKIVCIGFDCNPLNVYFVGRGRTCLHDKVFFFLTEHDKVF